MERRNSDVNVRKHAQRSSGSAPNGGKAEDAQANKRGDCMKAAAVSANQLPRGAQDGVSSDVGTSTSANTVPCSSSIEVSTQPSNMPDTQQIIQQLITDKYGPEIASCFLHALEYPTLTTESLAELDLNRVLNNPRLRHDIHFDRELHFRPNIDGGKGEEKQKQSADYFKAIQAELYIEGFVRAMLAQTTSSKEAEKWIEIGVASEKRVLHVFATIRDVIATLVPDTHQQTVKDRIDPEFMVQQIKRSVYDLGGLATWMAKIMKEHCAPQRDVSVNCMRDVIIKGDDEHDAEMLAAGIRHALNMMEYMKLDVANHQIRHMRRWLLESSVLWQQKYNAIRISTRKINVFYSIDWIDSNHNVETTELFTPISLDVLASAILRAALFNDERDICPPTFYLDVERLKNMRTDVLGTVYRAICVDVFTECASSTRSSREIDILIAGKGLEPKLTAIAGTSCQYVERLESMAA